VRIPMDLPIPSGPELPAIGVAGGHVHPATGYSVATSLRVAPRMAAAISAALARRATPASVAAAARDAAWPRPDRRVRGMHLYGASVVERLGTEQAQRFFDAFFGLP